MWLLCLAAVKPSKLPTLDAVTVAKHLWETSDLFATDVHGIVRCGPEGVPPRFRLAYMPCRNRGEILRLILEESQTAYELEVVGFQAWKRSVKATTPHGKLPVLRDFDGRGNDLGQEGAITRFLASECGPVSYTHLTLPTKA